MSTEKEEKVYRVFESIASGYDDANRRISLGRQDAWKEDMLQRVASSALPKLPCILDLCCGTGDIALALRKRLPHAKLYGLDFSPAMLEEAKRKEQASFGFAAGDGDEDLGASATSSAQGKAPQPAIKWILGNAMELPFGAGVFDAVIISFGLRNTPDYAAVIAEMRRVLKPAGRVYCLDSFKPSNPLILPFYKLYFSKLMPKIGGQGVCNEEYRWLNQSTDEFLNPKELAELFKAQGFAQTSTTRHMLGACCLVEAY